jgi:hypothetical protein
VKLTRRHARALATGAAATAAYLAGAKLSDSRVIRAGTLLTLALTATVSAQQASSLAKTNKKRLDQHIADASAAIHFVSHGGTIGGAVTVSGSLSASSLATGGGSITTSGGNLSMGTGDITCQDITATGGTGSTFGHIVMSGGNINLSGNNCNTASAYVISGAPHRADLGAGATLAQVQARCDFFNDTLISEGLLS